MSTTIPMSETETEADGKPATAPAEPVAPAEPLAPAAEAAPVPRPARAPARVPRWVALVVGVVALLGLAGTAFFATAWWGQRSAGSSTAQQTAQVRSAAGSFVSALTNFDPGTVDSDFSKIQAMATGQFATQAHQFFGGNIRQQLRTAGAASRGQIADLFVESLSGSQATVFAVVDQTYLNDKMTSPTADTLRLELVMTKGPHGWLISAVTVLQSPGGFPTTAPAPKGKG